MSCSNSSSDIAIESGRLPVVSVIVGNLMKAKKRLLTLLDMLKNLSSA